MALTSPSRDETADVRGSESSAHSPSEPTPDLTVIVPTRNERDNISPLLARLDNVCPNRQVDVLFVDDSADDTPAVIGQRAEITSRSVKVLHRPPWRRDGGLGGAVRAGLLEVRSKWVCVMDADLQHPPEVLDALLEEAERSGADVVVASRYCAGGGVGEFSFLRRGVSLGSVLLARVLFPRRLHGVSDPMSGFFLVRRDAIDPAALRPDGFKILLEILMCGERLAVGQVPFVFGERHAGATKASLYEGTRYVRKLIALRAQHWNMWGKPAHMAEVTTDSTVFEASQRTTTELPSQPTTALVSVDGGAAETLPVRETRIERQRDARPREAATVQCSVGIMAYNEEANIADAINAILEQQMESGEIAEVIVVASGCEDRTAEIVASMARQDPRVRLVEQPRREGKASAINLFINVAVSPVLLMVGADVLVTQGTTDALLRHFDDHTVGMVGGHPIPVNSETGLLGHAVHLQWRLHDRVARQSPKLGEIVAFRNVVPEIPFDSAVDEISIQALVCGLGYRLVYEPEAVVYNRGPTTIGDFLRQRRRIYAGHVRVQQQQGYAPSTLNGRRVLRAMWGAGSFTTPRAAAWTIATAGLEVSARALGRYDVLRRRPQHVWAIAGTTKLDIAIGANAHAHDNIAVFHIRDFHREQLEFGARAARQLTRQVADCIKQARGSQAIVSIQQSGTIVSLLPGDRAEAERAATQLMERLESTPFDVNRHDEPVRVRLSCAIISFPDGGPRLAEPISVPVLEANPAAAIAS